MSLPASASTPALVTASLLRAMGVVAADTWAPLLSASCQAHGISTRLRLAAFLSNILNETGSLTTLAENLNYDAPALLRQWPLHFTAAQAQAYGRTSAHPADQRQIAELAYGGRGGNGPPGCGDGWLYRGSGCMQTTFKGNYAALAKAIGWTRPLAELPEYIRQPAGAVESAAIFWDQAHCSPIADRGDIAAVRRVVNGGTIGLDNVQRLYARLLTMLPA